MATDLATIPQLSDSLELSGLDRETPQAVASGIRDSKAENICWAYASA